MRPFGMECVMKLRLRLCIIVIITAPEDPQKYTFLELFENHTLGYSTRIKEKD